MSKPRVHAWMHGINLMIIPIHNSGVDDEQNQSEDGEMTLTMAWHSAYNPYGLYYKGAGPKYPPSESSCDQFPKSKLFEDLPVADDAANIGIAFNPATIRSVHQLHIHIVSLPRRACIHNS